MRGSHLRGTYFFTDPPILHRYSGLQRAVNLECGLCKYIQGDIWRGSPFVEIVAPGIRDPIGNTQVSSDRVVQQARVPGSLREVVFVTNYAVIRNDVEGSVRNAVALVRS